MSASSPVVRDGEYAARGDYHRQPDPDWDYYPTYIAKLKSVRAWLDGLPRQTRVLDAGCGEGVLVDEYAGRLAIQGIDASYSSARVRHGSLTALPYPDGSFDRALCLDVLEHLVDPEQVLRDLHGVAAPDARLQVSLPNARHVSLMKDLIFRGTFGYTDWGHRDRTHLRWFTRRDIVEAMEHTGWPVQRVSHPELNKSRGLDRLTNGRSTEFLVGQWYVLGVRGQPTT